MRVENWQQRLVDAIRAHQGIPFGWGTSDCVRVWVDCVAAITGEDPVERVPLWSCPRSAVKALRSTGCASVAEYLGRKFERVAADDLRVGDLAYPIDNPGPLVSPGVVVGTEMINRNEQRWEVVPMAAALYGFKVG